MEEIQKLMEFQEYRDYLGIEGFKGYITVPQKFTSDDPEKTFQGVAAQLEKVEADLYLFAIGQVKMAISWRFKSVRPAVFLDIGGAMDAIAGHINPERPYAWGWVNHRLKGFDYSRIDFQHFQPRPDSDRWLG